MNPVPVLDDEKYDIPEPIGPGETQHFKNIIFKYVSLMISMT